MKVRPALESDLPQLAAISEAADSAAHWTQQQWKAIFDSQTPPRYAWIAEHDGRSIGFLIAQDGGPEWELENIAVLPEFRRLGGGLALLEALFAQARVQKAERILLEVRASNASVIQFYNLSGFQQLATRSNYYGNPPDDALIMVHPIYK